MRILFCYFVGRNTASNTLFTYETGQSHASMVDVNFIPVFFDQDLTAFFPNESKRLEVCAAI